MSDESTDEELMQLALRNLGTNVAADVEHRRLNHGVGTQEFPADREPITMAEAAQQQREFLASLPDDLVD